MRGPRNLPSIPQHATGEPEEIMYGGSAAPVDRRQGTVDDGFGLASVAHGSQQPHEATHESGYDHYASSAYDHQQQHQQHHQYQSYPAAGAGEYEHARGEGSSSAAGPYHTDAHYDDYQSSTGPPGYDSVAGGSGAYQHNHYPLEKS